MLSSTFRGFGSITPELRQRCRYQPFLEKACDAKEVIPFFKNGSAVAWSGFTPVGDAKAVPIALAEYVEQNKLQGKLQFHLLVGASAGIQTEDRWAKNHMILSRFPYQNSYPLRSQINHGKVCYADTHVSVFPTNLQWGFYDRHGKISVAVIEASEILEDGSIVLAGSVGSTVEILECAEKVIIELNTSIPSFKGIHDITAPWRPPGKPLNITGVGDRIGTTSVSVDPSKVLAIVESRYNFPGRSVASNDPKAKKIAGFIIDFFQNEVKHGRLPENLNPLQSGVGNIANAVVSALNESPFGNINIWTEVLQDSMLPMFDSGKIKFGSATSLTLSTWEKFYSNFDFYKSRMVLRTQQVSNSPEVIRRLGVIAMNTPIEADMYGHANSSIVNGSQLVNGLGGSGDFLRNGYISIMHCYSARKSKKDKTGVSCIMPKCSHIDHTEHDLDVLVTEQGLADMRGLSPVERAKLIIEKCVHPSYKDQMREYLEMATAETQKRGAGHEPQLLDKVFKMYTNLAENGTMHLKSW